MSNALSRAEEQEHALSGDLKAILALRHEEHSDWEQQKSELIRTIAQLHTQLQSTWTSSAPRAVKPSSYGANGRGVPRDEGRGTEAYSQRKKAGSDLGDGDAYLMHAPYAHESAQADPARLARPGSASVSQASTPTARRGLVRAGAGADSRGGGYGSDEGGSRETHGRSPSHRESECESEEPEDDGRRHARGFAPLQHTAVPAARGRQDPSSADPPPVPAARGRHDPSSADPPPVASKSRLEPRVAPRLVRRTEPARTRVVPTRAEEEELSQNAGANERSEAEAPKRAGAGAGGAHQVADDGSHPLLVRPATASVLTSPAALRRRGTEESTPSGAAPPAPGPASPPRRSRHAAPTEAKPTCEPAAEPSSGPSELSARPIASTGLGEVRTSAPRAESARASAPEPAVRQSAISAAAAGTEQLGSQPPSAQLSPAGQTTMTAQVLRVSVRAAASQLALSHGMRQLRIGFDLLGADACLSDPVAIVPGKSEYGLLSLASSFELAAGSSIRARVMEALASDDQRGSNVTFTLFATDGVRPFVPLAHASVNLEQLVTEQLDLLEAQLPLERTHRPPLGPGESPAQVMGVVTVTLRALAALQTIDDALEAHGSAAAAKAAERAQMPDSAAASTPQRARGIELSPASSSEEEWQSQHGTPTGIAVRQDATPPEVRLAAEAAQTAVDAAAERRGRIARKEAKGPSRIFRSQLSTPVQNLSGRSSPRSGASDTPSSQTASGKKKGRWLSWLGGSRSASPSR